MQALISGEIDILFTGPTPALPQLRAGTIKAYAVTSAKRLGQVSHLPTVEEAGVPG